MNITQIVEEKAPILEATLEPIVGEYTLADAIREGSTVTSQALGNWTDEEGGVCALTAAYLACKARHLL